MADELDFIETPEIHWTEVKNNFQNLIRSTQEDCHQSSVTGDDFPIPGLEDLDPVVTIGKKVWKLLELGKPALFFDSPTAHALPYQQICWTELEGWSAPESQILEIIYKNSLGLQVVHLRFRVMYNRGGHWNQSGSYLANVTVLPDLIDAAWGYTVSAEAQVRKAINIGTQSDPIAGLPLDIRWTIKTLIKSSMNSEPIFIRAR